MASTGSSGVRIHKTSARVILPIHDELFPDNPLETDEIRNSVWWVAKDGDRIVGFCGIKKLKYIRNGWFLCRCGVVRSHRGTGLQRRMIRVRLAHASRNSGRLVVTYTSSENLRSANNLIKCGFTLYRPHSEWGCDGALYFEKEI